MSRDDVERLRYQDDDAKERATRAPDTADAGVSTILGKTTTVATYPTAATAFYAILPCSLYGAETEGGSGSILAGAAVIYALNIGYGVPPAGTNVVCTRLKHRWVFRYDA